MSSNCLELLFLSFLYVSIDLCGRQSQRPRVSTNVSISWHLEIRPVLATEGESHQTDTLIDDSVLSLMVRGWGHPVMGSGQTRVR